MAAIRPLPSLPLLRRGAKESPPAGGKRGAACLEAIVGNAEAALDRLEKALAQRPALREWAKQDPDLESLRGHPRFQQLTNDQL